MTERSKTNTVYLKDYQAPHFNIRSVALRFELAEHETLVRSVLEVERNGKHRHPLFLHGQDLSLQTLAIDGQPLEDEQFSVDDEGLTIADVPAFFRFECVTRIEPQNNTSLDGLYKSRAMFCTQCEAEGFRKITYYPDRPDVLSVFTTTIVADAALYPVLLSNGNLVEQGQQDDGRHWATWHDPFPKPSYLFALVAGNLACLEDHFRTQSGRTVALKIFVEEKDLDKCDHAMASLKSAMRWDEEVYGREYDLDVFMIVAVDDFNMGAMENKGLNIFNTSCVLANPATTTDAGFERVEAVVAHEYFHNWSGNRVTCRDWFQLSLKEGFTVFRDAEFSADMGSRTVRRVENVQLLRSLQFAEDAGPMAHPVQPASFIEISNFYTLTIYEKGAEVVRMIHTLLGSERFRQGSDLYFERYDGQAVTIEDFVQAMADVSGRDFSQFMNWYRQAGTPVLDVSGRYDAASQSFHLTVKQHCPSTPDSARENKQPFHIPFAMGLLGEAGALRLEIEGEDSSTSESADNTHRVLEITQPEQTFVFLNIPEAPVPSLLRNFSAPVKLRYQYSISDLLRLMTRDDDGFLRWDASQQLGIIAIETQMRSASAAVEPTLIEGSRSLLENAELDPAMVALMLELPSETYLGECQDTIEVDAIHGAREVVRAALASGLEAQWQDVYHRCQTALANPSGDVPASALRSLKNRALNYLMQIDKPQYVDLCSQQFAARENMTDELAALTALVNCPFETARKVREHALADFYQRWQDEPLVVNQWLAVQAACCLPGTLVTVKQLARSAVFDIKNPNKVRSLIGVFANQNHIHFHDISGEGYAFLTDQIWILDQQNPQVAARLVSPLTKWRRYGPKRQALMKAQLDRIASKPDLSKDVFEVISKSLREKS